MLARQLVWVGGIRIERRCFSPIIEVVVGREKEEGGTEEVKEEGRAEGVGVGGGGR